MDALEVGAIVRFPQKPEWGIGQIQSIIGDRITVNFVDAGKVVLDRTVAELDLVRPDTLRHD